MANAPTPSKILLLILTAVYCQGYVPADGTLRVLSYISAQLLPATRTIPPRLGIAASEKDVLQGIEDILGGYKCTKSDRSLWEEYLSILQRIASLDSLFDFFASLQQLFKARIPDDGAAQITLSRTSLIGAFVRRSSLDFDKLSFQDAIYLWQAFANVKTTISFGRLPDDHGSEEAAAAEGVAAADALSGGRISTILDRQHNHVNNNAQDLERLISFQITQMQKYGNRLSDEMRGRLDELSSSPGNTRLFFYASFLDSWYAGDYPTSFEYLHRYYDYATYNKDRSHYQYALLNMAILHADFGCYDEAVAAMNESIAAARENKDTACLNFSLSWLHHLQTVFNFDRVSGGEGPLADSSSSSLAYLRHKALDGRMWAVASSTMFSEARLSLSLGRRPYEALGRLYEASHLNVQHELQGAIGTQLLIQSSIFARLGITTLSTSNCKLVTDCFSEDALTQDTLRARCRRANAAVLSGDYREAEKLLKSVESDTHRNVQLHQLAVTINIMLKLKRCLYCNDLATAEMILKSLQSSSCSDPEIQLHILLLRLEYHSRIGSLEQAYDTIHSSPLLSLPHNQENSSAPKGKDLYNQIRLLTAKALLFTKSSTPQRGLSLAIRATTAAMAAKILPALWEAVGALSKVLISINESQAALDLLESILWQATETEDAELLAMLQSTCADAVASMGRQVRHDKSACKEVMARALTWTQYAYKSYEMLGDVSGKQEMTAKAVLALEITGDEAGAAAKRQLFEKLEDDFLAAL